MDRQQEETARKLAAIIHAAMLAGAYNALAQQHPGSAGGFNKLAERQRGRVFSQARDLVGAAAFGG